MSKLIHLIYSSAATYSFTQDDLIELLTKARRNNARLGVRCGAPSTLASPLALVKPGTSTDSMSAFSGHCVECPLRGACKSHQLPEDRPNLCCRLRSPSAILYLACHPNGERQRNSSLGGLVCVDFGRAAVVRRVIEFRSDSDSTRSAT